MQHDKVYAETMRLLERVRVITRAMVEDGSSVDEVHQFLMRQIDTHFAALKAPKVNLVHILEVIRALPESEKAVLLEQLESLKSK